MMRCCRHGKRGCLASDWITERLNSPLINLKFIWLSLNITMCKPCLEHMATFHWFAEAEVPETTVEHCWIYFCVKLPQMYPVTIHTFGTLCSFSVPPHDSQQNIIH